MCKMTPMGARIKLEKFHFDILYRFGVIKESPPGEIGLIYGFHGNKSTIL